MNFESSEDRDRMRFVLHGRITYSDHVSFRGIIGRLKDSAAAKLEFDFDDVEFIDSAGLGMLLMIRDVAEMKGVSVVIRGAKGQVERVLLNSKFDSMFTFAR